MFESLGERRFYWQACVDHSVDVGEQACDFGLAARCLRPVSGTALVNAKTFPWCSVRDFGFISPQILAIDVLHTIVVKYLDIYISYCSRSSIPSAFRASSVSRS